MNERAIEAARLNTVAEQIVDTCRASRLGKTQESVDYNFDHSRAQCVDFVLTNLRGAALPPLRAREEIARVEVVECVQLEGLDPNAPAPDMYRVIINDGEAERCFDFDTRVTADILARAVNAVALSSTAGQEWRDMLAALRDARMALYNPFEPDNQSLTYKRIDAAIIKVESPAPPVAEPLLAEKQAGDVSRETLASSPDAPVVSRS